MHENLHKKQFLTKIMFIVRVDFNKCSLPLEQVGPNMTSISLL